MPSRVKRPNERRTTGRQPRLQPYVGWWNPKDGSPAVWKWRQAFLKVIERDAPHVLEGLESFRAMATEASSAVATLSSERLVTLKSLQGYIDFAEHLGGPARQRTQHVSPEPVNRLLDGLTAWCRKYHLQSDDHWVLDMAVNNLCNDSLGRSPFALTFYSWSPPILEGARELNLVVDGWTADGWETSTDWYERTLEQLSSQLRQHLHDVESELEGQDRYTRLPLVNEPGKKHFERAARWQVSEADWTSFLKGEGLIGEAPSEAEPSAHNLVTQMSNAIRRVGLHPRPGMKNTFTV